MKVIVDVQKLIDALSEQKDIEAYINLELAQIKAGNYPEWAEKKTSSRIAKMDGDYAQLFEDVWKAYPKKTGKGTAYIIWKTTIKKVDELFLRNNIIDALEWQKRIWEKDNNKFVPMLENYLKGRRWEDEKPKQTNAAPKAYF